MHESSYALFILMLAVKTDYSFGMQANIITTKAGNGQNGFAGDGGPASEAMLSSPGSVAVDSKGNIYFADWQNQRIRKISATGIITTVAGNGQRGFSGDGGPAINASLDLMNIDSAFSRNIDPNTGHPYVSSAGGIAVDEAGNLYMADANNQRVRKVDLDGVKISANNELSTVAGAAGVASSHGLSGYSGDGGPAYRSALASPYGVAVDKAGNIYIADTGNNRIRMIAPVHPTITLDSTRYCTGAPWSLGIATSVSGAWIRLIGTSDGIPWEVEDWAEDWLQRQRNRNWSLRSR